MTTNKKENAGFYSMPAIRYAHVLSELGISGAAVEETEEILEQTKELKEILEHPVITKENKHDIIDRISSSTLRVYGYASAAPGWALVRYDPLYGMPHFGWVNTSYLLPAE